MELTIPFIQESFAKFNGAYFNNMLRTPQFQIITSRQTLGRCKRKNGVITILISNYYNREKRDYEETIIHEMIHQWQLVMFNTADHRQTFRNKAWLIKRQSNGKYDIARTTSVNAPISNQGQAKVNRAFIPPIAVIRTNIEGVDTVFLIRLSKPLYARHFSGQLTNYSLHKTLGYLYNIPITNTKFPIHACRSRLSGKAMDVETFYRDYAEYAAQMTLAHMDSPIIQ